MMLSKKVEMQRLEKIAAVESRQLSPFDVPDYWKKTRAERLELIQKFARGEKLEAKTVDELTREALQLRDQVFGTSGAQAEQKAQIPRAVPRAPKPTAGDPPRNVPQGAGPLHDEVPPQMVSGLREKGSKFIPRPGGTVQQQSRVLPQAAEKPIGERLVTQHTLHPAEPVVLNERGLRYTLIHSGMELELKAYIARIWDSYRYAFDFEANTEDPLNNRDNLDVAGISFSIAYGEAVYIPINHWGYTGNWGIEVLELFRGLFESRNHLKIPFNMAYEDMVLAILGYDLKLPIFDPFLGLNLLKTTPAASAGQLALKPNIKERFGYDMITYDEITQREIVDSYDKQGQPKYKTIQVKFNELIPDARVLEYGGADSDWALRLADPVMEELKEQGLYELCTEVDIPLQKCLTRMALIGWQADAEKFEELEKLCRPLIDKYEFAFLDDVKKQMRFPDHEPLLSPTYWREYELGWRQEIEIAKKNKKVVVDQLLSEAEIEEYVNSTIRAACIGGDIFGYSFKLDPKKQKTTITYRTWADKVFFNMGSWQQLAKLWYDVLKLPSVDRKDPRGTSEEIVEKLKKKMPLPMFDSIIEWRGYSKLMSTYIIGYSSRMDPKTGRIHTTLDQVYVRTGRFASKSPNLQNAPRSDNDSLGIRNGFIAPNVFYIHVPGDWNPMEPSIYVHTDYSQIELRVFAHYSKDPNMSDAFFKGQDVHSRTAWQMYRLGEPWVHPKTKELRNPLTVEQVPDFAKDIRNYAKTINFG